MSEYLSLEVTVDGSRIDFTLYAINPFTSPTEMGIRWKIEFPKELNVRGLPTQGEEYRILSAKDQIGRWSGLWLDLPGGRPLKPIKVSAEVTSRIPTELTFPLDKNIGG
jgi:hypothetical protein